MTINKHFFYLLLFVITVLSSCSNAKEREYREKKQIVDSLILTSKQMLLQDYHQSKFLAQKAIKLSQNIGFTEGVSNGLGMMASVNNQYGYYKIAHQQIDSALAIAQNSHLDYSSANNQQIKGFIYFTQSKYDSAYMWYMKALPFFLKELNKSLVSDLYSKIGRIYYNKREYQQALVYYRKALALTQIYEYDKAAARELNNIGSVYELQGKHEEALEYFKKALNINLKDNRKEWVAINYHNIAQIFSDQAKVDSAEYYFKMALSIDQELGNKSNIAEDLYALGSFYQKQNRHSKAIEHFIKSEKLCKMTANLHTLCRVYEGLSISHTQNNNNTDALINYKNFHLISDSLFNSKGSKRITEMEISFKYDLEKSRAEIKQQKKIIFLLSIMGGLLLIAFFTTMLYKKSKENEKSSFIKKNILEDKLTQNEAVLITNIMKLSEKNETLNLILQDLKGFSLKLKKQDQDGLQKIIRSIQQNMNDNIWKEFEIRFQEVNANFYEKLSNVHPDLSPNETRLCAFLKMNMSTKEISSITHQNPQSINVARSRLRKKLKLTHTDKNIFEYLSEL